MSKGPSGHFPDGPFDILQSMSKGCHMENSRSLPDWNTLYDQQKVEDMPWYHEELDPDISRFLSDSGITEGSILDLGTGPATQALALAGRGFRVTATDVSETAIRLGREKAAASGLDINFLVDDILAVKIQGPFDIVIDRGCFHVFAPPLRSVFVKNLSSLIDSGGLFFLKTFSHKETRPDGPYRFSIKQIIEYFAGSFELLQAWDSQYQGTLKELPLALCAVLRKI